MTCSLRSILSSDLGLNSFESCFHVICKISNFNTWTAKHLARASCTELTLIWHVYSYFPIRILVTICSTQKCGSVCEKDFKNVGYIQSQHSYAISTAGLCCDWLKELEERPNFCCTGFPSYCRKKYIKNTLCLVLLQVSKYFVPVQKFNHI